MASHIRSDKHGPGDQPDPAIKSEIEKQGKNSQLPCAVAFKVIETLGVSAAEVGKTTDLIGFELVKCQLGLFGYKPNKKIVKPKKDAQQEIIDTVTAESTEGRLTCKAVWNIAARFKVPKMTVSGVCEVTGIKIKPCQLGAF